MSDVIWVIQEKLPPFDRGDLGRDSLFYEDVSLRPDSDVRVIKNAVERWFGGNWPDDPLVDPRGSTKRLQLGDLDLHLHVETPRSVIDRNGGRGDVEFILYPPSMTLQEALALISVDRIDEFAEGL